MQGEFLRSLLLFAYLFFQVSQIEWLARRNAFVACIHGFDRSAVAVKGYNRFFAVHDTLVEVLKHSLKVVILVARHHGIGMGGVCGVIHSAVVAIHQNNALVTGNGVIDLNSARILLPAGAALTLRQA